MMSWLKRLLAHKWLLGLLVLILGGGTYIYAKGQTRAEPVRYVLAEASKGSLIVSLRGSGQVSGQNQLEVKPLVSGAITRVLVSPGQTIKTGDVLFEIDRKTALRTVRDAAQSVTDARIALQTADLSLKKLKQPPAALTLLQAQHSVSQAERALLDAQKGPDLLDIQQAEADLQTQQDRVKLSTDGKTPQSVRDAYDEVIPVLKTTAQSFQQLLFDTENVLGTRDGVIKDPYTELVRNTSALVQASNSYLPAKTAVDTFRLHIDAMQLVNESPVRIEQLLKEAQETAVLLDPFLRLVNDVIVSSLPTQARSQSSIDTLRNTIQSDRSTLVSRQTSLTAQAQAITAAKDAHQTSVAAVAKAQVTLDKLKQPVDPDVVTSAREKLAEVKESLAQLQQGPEEIELLTSQNTIDQRRASLQAANERLADAQEALNEYSVRAPFDGVAARVSSQKGDTVSPSTAVATLLTDAKIAQLSVNEVDAAKLKTGQKATLTFDAVPDVSIAGEVYEIDSLGTVSQGVVNYAVKILFQTQDERIKSGMSVSASIIIDLRTDVVLVPNAAVRRTNGATSLQVLSTASSTNPFSSQGVVSLTPPEERRIEVGLSNNEFTEVTQSLAPGEYVVTRVIDPATQAARPATTAAPGGAAGGIRLQGLGGFGGGLGGGAARPAGR